MTGNVRQGETAFFTFTPTIPADDGTGLGQYEYFCEIHPNMHGRFILWKDPDLNNNGRVEIFDASILGQAYASRPGDPAWRPDADLNNNLVVDIFDASRLGQLYPKILVD